MYGFLIKEYVNKLSMDEINDFSVRQGIELNKDELQLVYDTIKTKWRTLIYGNPKPILEYVKSSVRPITYNKIEALYREAKEKYSI